jgi:Co/Zn/Cd efflux system component
MSCMLAALLLKTANAPLINHIRSTSICTSQYSDSPHRFLADPICSLVITAFIGYTSVPLVRHAAMMLLQPVPAGLDLDELKASLLAVRKAICVCL